MNLNAILPSIRHRVICALLWLLPFNFLYGQGSQQGVSSQQASAAREIFSRIQDGLSSGSIDDISRFLASPVCINLRGAESGYYSVSQARYLLENYLRLHRLGRFTFTTVDDSGTNPYATGSVAFNYRGNRERAQIYVSLSPERDRWVITQINIY